MRTSSEPRIGALRAAAVVSSATRWSRALRPRGSPTREMKRKKAERRRTNSMQPRSAVSLSRSIPRSGPEGHVCVCRCVCVCTRVLWERSAATDTHPAKRRHDRDKGAGASSPHPRPTRTPRFSCSFPSRKEALFVVFSFSCFLFVFHLHAQRHDRNSSHEMAHTHTHEHAYKHQKAHA